MFKEADVRMIRSHTKAMEKSGVVPQEVLDYLYENKLFKLYLPEVLGGSMLTLPEALSVIERASWVDGSFGWLVMIGAGGGFFCSLLPHEQNLKFFLPPDAVIAGSGHPSGIARKVAGGYEVTGVWKYCSGSQYASIFTANCVLESSSGQETPEIRAFVFMPEQVRIIEDWHAFGLKATGSHSIAVDAIFVPDERTFSYLEPFDSYNNLAFSYPFMQFAEATICAVSIGICKHFIGAAKLFINELRPVWDKVKPERYASVMQQIESVEAFFNQITEDFTKKIESSWDTLNDKQIISDTALIDISLCCKNVAKSALEIGQKIFPLLGIQAIMEHAPVNQIYRDLQVVSQHSALN